MHTARNYCHTAKLPHHSLRPTTCQLFTLHTQLTTPRTTPHQVTSVDRLHYITLSQFNASCISALIFDCLSHTAATHYWHQSLFDLC